MTKITIERETLEMALAALGEYERHYGWRIGPTVELRAALAQKAEPPSMPQGKSLALLDLDSVEHMQGGANGPTIRLRGFINAHTGPTAPQPPIDNAFVAEECEQFSPPAEPAPVPCCGKYETCSHACTPRGKWLGRREAEMERLQPGWRDIESAPKDGTRIILGSSDGAWMAEYQPVYQSGYRPDNPWFSVMLNHAHMGRFPKAKPTHWQPIPPAPKATK